MYIFGRQTKANYSNEKNMFYHQNNKKDQN